MSTFCQPACAPVAPGSLPIGPGPAGAVTATGIDCDGNPVVVTAVGVTQAVPHPNTVQLVRICNPGEFDHTILCDPSGGQVVVVVAYSPVGVPSISYFNVDGSPFAGDPALLRSCPGVVVESDATPMCDGGATTFLRWFIKVDGVPSGTTYDTTYGGLPYTPAGVVSYGVCELDVCPQETPIGVITDWSPLRP